MNHDSLRSFCAAVVLSLAAAAGGWGCIVPALGLTVGNPAALLALWVLTAVLCGLCMPRRWGTALVFLWAALGFVWLMRQQPARDQCLSFLMQLLETYANAYGFRIRDFSVPYLNTALRDVPLGILGVLAQINVCWAVTGRRPIGLALFFTGLPLLLCMVVTDTVPGIWGLLLTLGVMALLLLTENVRQESVSQSSRLLGRVVLPLAAALGLLLLLAPQEGYVNRAAELRQQLLDYGTSVSYKIQETDFALPLAPPEPAKVDLAGLKGQERRGIPVMEIVARTDGTKYLRGQDYDRYTGIGWEATPQRQELFAGAGEPVDHVTIHTRTAKENLFLAYYPQPNTMLQGGALSNPQKLTQYDVACCAPSPTSFPLDLYQALPETTAQGIRAVLNRIPGDYRTTESAVESIRRYVMETAPYSRRTEAMPTEEEDFAIWFLEQGRTGFCVHYATAAAVLLRSVGIPARYVTGYRVEAEADQPVTVTSDDAHAWVEYYNFSTNLWGILDATPPEEEEAVQEPPETTAPETSATMPPEKEPTEEPAKAPIPWKTLGRTAVLLAAVGCIAVGQHYLRLYLRRRRQNRGTANERCLALWQEAELLARLLKQAPPEELKDLAEKARYSRHPIQETELEQFHQFRRKARRELSKRNRLRNLIDRYVHAAY